MALLASTTKKRAFAEHTAFLKGFKKSGLRRTKHIILGYIRPVEFNGDTLEILG